MSETPQHGKKRPAENDPDGDQPLAKKFGRLQIGMFVQWHFKSIIPQHLHPNFAV